MLFMCIVMCMRTNIVIDDDLMRKAMKAAGTKTKRDTVAFALSELVKREGRQRILELEGKIDILPIEEIRPGDRSRDWSL